MRKKIGTAILTALILFVTLPAVAVAAGHGLPVFSLSVTTPQKLALSGGYAYLIDPKANSEWAKGMVVRIEPGIAGTKAHLGAYFIGSRHWDRLFSSATFSALRTYGNPWGVKGAQTYLGGELAASLFPLLRINGGLYRNASPDEGKDWLFSIGLGVGF